MWQSAGLALAVLGASGAAGAFNHYYERDLDRLMKRTRSRPFASGLFQASPAWPAGFLVLLVASLALAGATGGTMAAAFVFLGAFTYGIVYTVWLKRRSVWNIVVGGLAGSFAVLAGAAAVDPSPQVVPTLLAIVLFLWTPPHFWSLAAAKGEDYTRAGVPMLPLVAPTLCLDARHPEPHCCTCRYFARAALVRERSLLRARGGIWRSYIYLRKSWRLHRQPDQTNAMKNFLASLLQLALLIAGILLDGAFGSWP